MSYLGPLLAILAYLGSCLFVGLIASAVVDPYGHLAGQPWKKWPQVLFIAALWPFLLAYVVVIFLYESWRGRS